MRLSQRINELPNGGIYFSICLNHPRRLRMREVRESIHCREETHHKPIPGFHGCVEVAARNLVDEPPSVRKMGIGISERLHPARQVFVRRTPACKRIVNVADRGEEVEQGRTPRKICLKIQRVKSHVTADTRAFEPMRVLKFGFRQPADAGDVRRSRKQPHKKRCEGRTCCRGKDRNRFFEAPARNHVLLDVRQCPVFYQFLENFIRRAIDQDKDEPFERRFG